MVRKALLLMSLRQELLKRGDPFKVLQIKVAQAVNAVPGPSRTRANELLQKARHLVDHQAKTHLRETEAAQRAVEKERLRTERENEIRAREIEASNAMAAEREERRAKKESLRLLTDSEASLMARYDALNASDAPPAIGGFSSIGSDDQREADRRLESALRDRYARQKETQPELAFGQLLESFMQAELSRQDWFGAAFIRPTDFDDYTNGVDGILEWPDEDPMTAVRLAVDFTVAETPELLRDKLDKVERGVRVKYFRSRVRNVRGRAHEASISGVPMVVLGVDRATLRKTLEETGGDPEKLSEHPIRALMVEQAFAQVGKTVREMCARLVGNVAGREVDVSERLRAAVAEYDGAASKDSGWQKKTADVAAAFARCSKEEFTRGFRSPEQGARLYELLRVFGRLEERQGRIREEYAAAKTWIGASRTHKRLSMSAHATLRLSGFRLPFFSRLRELAQSLLFGFLRFAFELVKHVEHVFARSFQFRGQWGASFRHRHFLLG